MAPDAFGIISSYLDDRSFRALHCVSKSIFQVCYQLPKWQAMLKARLGEAALDHYPPKEARAMTVYVAWLNKPSSTRLTLGISDDRQLITRDIQGTFPIERVIDIAPYPAWESALKNHLYPTTHVNQTFVVGSMTITHQQGRFHHTTIKPTVVLHRMNSDLYVLL